jgi:hypothetical protein
MSPYRCFSPHVTNLGIKISSAAITKGAASSCRYARAANQSLFDGGVLPLAIVDLNGEGRNLEINKWWVEWSHVGRRMKETSRWRKKTRQSPSIVVQ